MAYQDIIKLAFIIDSYQDIGFSIIGQPYLRLMVVNYSHTTKGA